ncbi:MAG: hypothetical protein PARBB_03111 [Parabacteroides distasonis]
MKKIKYAIIALCAAGLTACSDTFMDTNPTDQIGETTVASSLENLYTSLNGVHRAMVKQYLGSQSCGGEPSWDINRDVLGEDLVHPSTGNSWFLATARWVDHRNAKSTLNKYGFFFYYKLALNANLILNSVDEVPRTDENLYAGVKGEALCFRAFSHFQLVQLYGERYQAGANNTQLGVPYRKAPESTELARNTVEECYQYINEDLDSAIELLKNYEAATVTHLSLKVAYGLKARVMLAQQKYAEAANYADLAIQTAEKEGHKLMDGEEALCGFASILTDNKEAIWAANTQDDQTIYFYSFYAYMSWNFNASAIRAVPRCINSNLYDKISDTDIRKQWWDPTGEAEVPTSSFKRFPYQNRKFRARSSSNAVGDFPFMRLSELYLMKAEALARNNQTQEAQSVLTTFATKRDPKYKATSTNAAQLIEEIMIQRRVELWGEGFRFTDLKRLNLPLNRSNSNHDKAISVKMEVSAGSNEWQFMIPQEEMDANSLMVQNK